MKGTDTIITVTFIEHLVVPDTISAPEYLLPIIILQLHEISKITTHRNEKDEAKEALHTQEALHTHSPRQAFQVSLLRSNHTGIRTQLPKPLPAKLSHVIFPSEMPVLVFAAVILFILQYFAGMLSCDFFRSNDFAFGLICLEFRPYHVIL